MIDSEPNDGGFFGLESNWRFNVWKYGWQYHGIRFLAAMLDLPGRWLSDFGIPGFKAIFMQDPSTPVEFLVPAGFIVTSPAFPHFPYGRNVEPD